jgi:transcriptional regulator of acetoin/glycerol metabolism
MTLPAVAAAASAAGAAAAADDPDDDEPPDVARVRQALDAARWRRGRAAEILGVSPRTLYRWMKRLKL